MGHAASREGGGHSHRAVVDTAVREPLVPEPPLERIVAEIASNAFGVGHDGGAPATGAAPLPTYAHNHLVGSEVVAWMTEQLWCSGRARALQLGQSLVHAGYLVPVGGGEGVPHFSDDEHAVYRLDDSGGGVTAGDEDGSGTPTPGSGHVAGGHDYDLVVVGAGAAGVAAATFAAKLGVRVALVDKRLPGGDNLWTASIPSKALAHIAKTVHACRHAGAVGVVIAPPGVRVDMSLVRSHIARVQAEVYKDMSPAALAKKGCDVITGTAAFLDGRTLEVVLADDDIAQLAALTSARSPSIPGFTSAGGVSTSVLSVDGSGSPVPSTGAMPAAAIAASAYTRGRSWSAASRLGGYAQPHLPAGSGSGILSSRTSPPSGLSPVQPGGGLPGGVGVGGGATVLPPVSVGSRSPTLSHHAAHIAPPPFSLPTIGEGKEGLEGMGVGRNRSSGSYGDGPAGSERVLHVSGAPHAPATAAAGARRESKTTDGGDRDDDGGGSEGVRGTPYNGGVAAAASVSATGVELDSIFEPGHGTPGGSLTQVAGGAPHAPQPTSSLGVGFRTRSPVQSRTAAATHSALLDASSAGTTGTTTTGTPAGGSSVGPVGSAVIFHPLGVVGAGGGAPSAVGPGASHGEDHTASATSATAMYTGVGGGRHGSGDGSVSPQRPASAARLPPGPPPRSAVPPLATARMSTGGAAGGGGALGSGRRRTRTIKAQHILIATGSQPTIPADIAGLESAPYLTTDTVYDNGFLPRRLIIIGGGPAGVELAQAYGRLGSEVTIIAPALLPREESTVRDTLRRVFYKERILHVASRAVRVEHRFEVPAQPSAWAAAPGSGGGMGTARPSFNAGRPMSPDFTGGAAATSSSPVDTSAAGSPGGALRAGSTGVFSVNPSRQPSPSASEAPSSGSLLPALSPAPAPGAAGAHLSRVPSLPGAGMPAGAARTGRAYSLNMSGPAAVAAAAATAAAAAAVTGTQPSARGMGTSRGSFSGRLSTGAGRGDDASAPAPIIVHTAGGDQYTADMLVVACGRSANLHSLNLPAAGVTVVTPPSSATAQAAAAFPPAPTIRVNAQLQTSQRSVYAAGDVVDAREAHAHLAAWQGFHAARNALLPGHVNGMPEAVPRVTYTDPEIACVGWTAAEAVSRLGVERVRVVTRDSEEVDRARIDGDSYGSITLVVGKDGAILGATIIGARASEVISEVSLALSCHLKVNDVAMALHAYPTYSSILHAAASAIATDAYVGASAVGRVLYRGGGAGGGGGGGGGSGGGGGGGGGSSGSGSSAGYGSARVVPHPVGTGSHAGSLRSGSSGGATASGVAALVGAALRPGSASSAASHGSGGR